jgi:hypothetical protein
MTDTATGKSIIVTKIFDEDCDICKQMSRHDRATFENFDELAYQEVALEDVINHNGNLTKVRIYQCLERYCLSPTYEIDLPIYLFLTKQGQYMGHQQGAATIVELRDKIKEILEDTPE